MHHRPANTKGSQVNAKHLDFSPLLPLPDHPHSPAPQSTQAPAATSGVVADLHREIEHRLDIFAEPTESRGEVFWRQVSRAVGIGALIGGYVGVIYLIFG